MNKMINNVIVVVAVAIGMNTGHAQSSAETHPPKEGKMVNGVLVKESIMPRRSVIDLVQISSCVQIVEEPLNIRGTCGSRSVYIYIDGVRNEPKVHLPMAPTQYHCPEGGIDLDSKKGKRMKNKAKR
jgi:hypothetical protein